MSPSHFANLIHAETVKLFSRTTARLGLVLLVVLGALPPLILFAVRLGAWWWTGSLDAEWMPGQSVREAFSMPAADSMVWALRARNFFVVKAFLVMLGAQIFAGEYQAHTLREDLLRPIPRWSVLGAKWLAMCTWIAVTAIFAWAVATALGLALFWDMGGDWQQPILGYFSAIMADAGFAALVLLISVLSRSVPFTIAGVLLFAIMDYALDWILWLAKLAPNLPVTYAKEVGRVAEVAYPWMPFSAFGVWRGYEAMTPWAWQGFVSLLVIGLGSLVLSWALFRRMDVP